VSFADITLCVASQRAIPKVSVYFIIDSVRKLSDTPSYGIISEWIFGIQGGKMWNGLIWLRITTMVMNSGVP
jgi:hypothetical protein